MPLSDDAFDLRSSDILTVQNSSVFPFRRRHDDLASTVCNRFHYTSRREHSNNLDYSTETFNGFFYYVVERYRPLDLVCHGLGHEPNTHYPTNTR